MSIEQFDVLRKQFESTAETSQWFDFSSSAVGRLSESSGTSRELIRDLIKGDYSRRIRRAARDNIARLLEFL